MSVSMVTVVVVMAVTVAVTMVIIMSVTVAVTVAVLVEQLVYWVFDIVVFISRFIINVSTVHVLGMVQDGVIHEDAR